MSKVYRNSTTDTVVAAMLHCGECDNITIVYKVSGLI